MSQIMDHLEIGDKLEFKGPRGDFELDQNEKRAVGETFCIHQAKESVAQILMT